MPDCSRTTTLVHNHLINLRCYQQPETELGRRRAACSPAEDLKSVASRRNAVDLQSCLSEQGLNQAAFMSEAADRQVELQVQFLKVQAGLDAQLDMFEMLPSGLEGVKSGA